MGARLKLAMALALAALAIVLGLRNWPAPRTPEVLCACIGAMEGGDACWLATGQRVPHDAARELCAFTRALQ